MPGRNEILFRIRKSLGGREGVKKRVVAGERRIEAHSAGTIPKSLSRKSKKSRFTEKAIASVATVKSVKSYDKVGAAIDLYLREHNLPSRLRKGSDKRLVKLGWRDKGGPEITVGPSRGDDLVSLSHAEGGIAETGALVLVSGEANPTTLNFLPENHIIVVREKDISENYEAIWTKLRRKYGMGKMPRTVNMICGPSRSADIEQTLIMGAHGPIRLHIIIVSDSK